MNKKEELLNQIRSLSARVKEKVSGDHFSEKEVGEDLQKLYEYFLLYKHAEDTRPEASSTHSPISENGKVSGQHTDLFSSVTEYIPPQAVKKETPAPPPQPENTVIKTYRDVKDTIGLNDRFRFTNELFQGSAQEYTAVIDQLNTMSSVDEAEVFLNSIRGIYEWKEDNATAEEFVSLVQKRYT